MKSGLPYPRLYPIPLFFTVLLGAGLSFPLEAQSVQDRTVEVVVEDLRLEQIPAPPGGPSAEDPVPPEPVSDYLPGDPDSPPGKAASGVFSPEIFSPPDGGPGAGDSLSRSRTGAGFPSGYGLGAGAGMGQGIPLFSAMVLGPGFQIEAGRGTGGHFFGQWDLHPGTFWNFLGGIRRGEDGLLYGALAEGLFGGDFWDLGLAVQGAAEGERFPMASSLDFRYLPGNPWEVRLKIGAARGGMETREGILELRYSQDWWWISAGGRLGSAEEGVHAQPVLGAGSHSGFLSWEALWGSRFFKPLESGGPGGLSGPPWERVHSLQNLGETRIRLTGPDWTFSLGSQVFSDNVTAWNFQGFEVRTEAALGPAEAQAAWEPWSGNWSASAGLLLPLGRVYCRLQPGSWGFFWKKEWE